MRIARPWSALLLSGFALVALACSRTEAPPRTPEPPRSAPAALAVQNVEIGRAVGGDKRVTDRTTTFHPNDTIYASVATSGRSSNAVPQARWSYEDGQIVEESQQSIAPTESASTEFHIAKPDGWPAGKYKVEVLLNGALAQTREFEVR